MVEKLYYTFENLKDDLMTVIRLMTLNGYIPEVIVGPARGALIPGTMLSHYYNIPFQSFLYQLRDIDKEQDEAHLRAILDRNRGKRILIIDDINDSGATLLGISKIVESSGVANDVKYSVLFTKTQSGFQDISWSAKTLTPDNNPWVVFPYEEWWGFRSHGALSSP